MEYFLNFYFKTNQEYSLIPEGYIIASEQIPITSERIKEPFLTDNFSVLKVAENEASVDIIARNFRITFDRVLGRISSYEYYKEELISKAGGPNFWRAPTDNDFGNGMDKRCKIWKEASRQKDVQKFSVKQIGKDEVQVEVVKSFKDGKAQNTTLYRIFGNGDIEVNSSFKPNPKKERDRNYIVDFNDGYGPVLNFTKDEPIYLELPDPGDIESESFTIETMLKASEFYS